MNRRVFRNSAFLKAIYHTEPLQRKAMIETTEEERIRTLCDLARNILHGRIYVSNSYKDKLKEYTYVIRSLASSRVDVARKRRTLLAYHKLIPLLIKPVLHLLDES